MITLKELIFVMKFWNSKVKNKNKTFVIWVISTPKNFMLYFFIASESLFGMEFLPFVFMNSISLKTVMKIQCKLRPIFANCEQFFSSFVKWSKDWHWLGLVTTGWSYCTHFTKHNERVEACVRRSVDLNIWCSTLTSAMLITICVWFVFLGLSKV